ncbi:MAG TPA: endonuclease/exonuclease/phosphatase family protein [Bacteroidia bacterium]|nr:endonuclease/exonuclease/phosphatase family protein [Bacteroidia bacterium]HNT80135.1 endonuclease/exonuclease/phosphatase family protein [Bacteroidia bacterium]
MIRSKKNTLRFYLFSIWVVAISLLLILTLASSIFNPSLFWPFATLSIGYQFIFIINLLNLILCIYLNRKIAVAPLLVFLLGFYTMTGFYRPGIFVKTRNINPDHTAKIMSYNCRLFDFYNWASNKKTRNDIVDMLHKENPDILCFQEFFDSDEIGFRNLKMIDKTMGSYFVHSEFPIILRGKDRYGMATISRFPIVRKEVIKNSDSKMNMCLISDVVIEQDTLRIFNLHLQSVRFNAAEFKFIQNIEEGDANQRLVTSKQVLKRLRNGFIKRKLQVDAIVEKIDASPYPILLCGDFNDTPASYAYRKLSDNLDDAYRVSGKGLSSTYVGPLPFLRIDYIMHDEEVIESESYKVIRQKFSDHYPIVCNIKINSTTAEDAE